MQTTEQLIEAGKKPTLDSIANDLNNGDWSALYYATEAQIAKLIDAGRICEDFFSRHQSYQEEMQSMLSYALAEFA